MRKLLIIVSTMMALLAGPVFSQQNVNPGIDVNKNEIKKPPNLTGMFGPVPLKSNESPIIIDKLNLDIGRIEVVRSGRNILAVQFYKKTKKNNIGVYAKTSGANANYVLVYNDANIAIYDAYTSGGQYLYSFLFNKANNTILILPDGPN